MTRLSSLVLIWLVSAVLFLAVTVSAGPVPKSDGQTVYVPVYSHIYGGNRERPFNLAVTLSIRNTDLSGSIRISSVEYFNSEGLMVKKYLDQEMSLGPLATLRYVVRESDTTGGSGANFIVRWHSDTAVSPPLIESVMIGTQSQQGISFTSRGQVICD
jgi:hypothetical protein